MTTFYLTQVNKKEAIINAQVGLFDTYFDKFFNNTVNLFILQPKLNYYYDELFNNNINTDNSIRDKILENKLTTILFLRIEVFINYLENYDASAYEYDIIYAQQKFIKILGIFFKSPILNEYWVQYKKLYASPLTIDFINKNLLA
jgi:hypothetical protein